MEERIKCLKNKAKEILHQITINSVTGDAEMIKTLQDMEEREIKEDEIDILERIVENSRLFFHTKILMKVIGEDYDYLKTTAERLRNQRVRVKDGVIIGQPIFEVALDENTTEKFITKTGAQNFIDANSTSVEHINEKDCNNKSERRKKQIFEVSTNNNLEVEKLIEIIIRNY